MRGIPLRIEIGPKDIENNHCVIAKRNDGVKQTVELDADLAGIVTSLLQTIHEEMLEKANQHRLENTHEVKTYAEFKEVLETKGGYVKAMWCGDEACEIKIKEDTNATSRCMKDEETAHSDTCVCCGKKAKHIVYFAKAY